MAERHPPREACIRERVHCYTHGVDEHPRANDYRVCGECWHIFRTADELVEAYHPNSPFRFAWPQNLKAEQIGFCPYCAHDW